MSIILIRIPIAELRESQKKTDEQFRKTDEQIVAVGENRIPVVEVKKRMEEDMVDDFPDRKIPRFRQIFPEYRDFPIIGGVGALVMQDSVSRYAEKKKLYVLTQNGEGGAMLVNRRNFRAKEF